MMAARSAGAVTSFDLNFRAKLWKVFGGEDRAVEILRNIVSNVDVLVGNEEDLQKGLGIPGPEVAAKSKLDPSAFFGMIDRVRRDFPGIKVVATTLREVHSTNRHRWGAVAWIDGKTCIAPTAELDIYDRVGGGDGFASGLFYGMLTGEEPEEAVKLGWAHGALLTTTPGDTTMVTVDQVRAFAKGGSAGFSDKHAETRGAGRTSGPEQEQHKGHADPRESALVRRRWAEQHRDIYQQHQCHKQPKPVRADPVSSPADTQI